MNKYDNVIKQINDFINIKKRFELRFQRYPTLICKKTIFKMSLKLLE